MIPKRTQVQIISCSLHGLRPVVTCAGYLILNLTAIISLGPNYGLRLIRPLASRLNTLVPGGLQIPVELTTARTRLFAIVPRSVQPLALPPPRL